MGEVILECRNVVKRFGTIEALKGVSFKLRESEVLGLIGDNGAGKSTLIKIIRGAIEPSSGDILVKGELVHFKRPSDATLKGLQCVYQDLALVDKMTVVDNFFLGRELRRKLLSLVPILNTREMKAKARQGLDYIGYKDVSVDSRVENLSGGQRQAIAVARAVFSEPEPEIVLMDEPTSALSEKGKEEVLQLVRSLRDSHSVILVTHDLNSALAVCDRIAILKLGEIVFESDVSDDLSPQELLEYM